jgi:hypothetical protein
MFTLIKKEFLIVKNLVFATMAIILLIPLLLNFIAPTRPSIIALLYMVLMSILILLQATSTEEEKTPKASSFLCAIGYSRKSFILAKYTFFLLEYVFCLVVYVVMSLLFDSFAFLNINEILITLLAGVVVVSIYIPVLMKYGSVIARYIFTTIILLVSMGPSLAIRLLQNISIDFSFFKAMSQITIFFTLGLTILTILSLSIMTSIKIYSEKEL